jgi:hypothetical protein
VDLKTSKDIEILVLTCPSYEHLVPEFTRRFHKYYGVRPLKVWSSSEVWSTSLINALTTVEDEYLIILHEDFYFTHPIDRTLVDTIVRYMHEHKEVGRICCSTGIHAPERVFHHEDIFWKYKDDAEFLCSFDPGIWRKEFLLRYLQKDEDPWKGEVRTSSRAKHQGETILWSETPVFIYKDATRDGKPQKVPEFDVGINQTIKSGLTRPESSA